RYLLIKLLPLPIGLLLTTLLMMLLHIGGLDAESLLLVSVLFGLTIWRLVIYSLAQPFFIRLADALNPDLSAESENIKQITHLSMFFIVLASVILQLLTATTPNLTLLLTLIITAGFLWLSDRTYPQLIVRYLVLGFSVLAGMVLIALTPWQALTTENYAALLFTLLSLAVGALVAIPTNAYTKPAAHTAILLAFIGIYLQIIPTGIIAPLDYTVLFLAGFSLLRVNAKLKWTACTTMSLMVLVLATLWLENSIFHAQQPFSLWLGTQTFADLWLVLGLLSFAMSLLSHALKSVQKWADIYCMPLNTVATLGFTWSLLGTLTLFFITAGQANLLVILLLVSLLTLFSLSKNRSGAAQSRGFASACLPTLIVFSLLPANLDGFSLQAATALFGYTLWCCASFILPTFNKRYNDWTITPDFFPWLGLLLVVFSGCWWQEFNIINVGVYCLELSIYCLLMLRYSRWVGFSWASAFTLTAAVVAFNFDSEHLLINLLLWGNLQLLLVTVWQRKGDEKLPERWQWQQAPLALAFQFTSKFIFVSYLLVTSILLWIAIIDNNSAQNVTLSDSLSIGILLNLSFLHLLWLRFSSAALHCFIYTLLLSLWTLYFNCLNTLFHPPLFLSLWSMTLLGSIQVVSWFHCPHQDKITATITYWVKFFVAFATIGLMYYSVNDLAERLLSLAIVTGLSAVLGWRSTRSIWLVIAFIEVLVFLHLYPFLLIDNADFYTLLPWYALQITLFMCLSTWLASNIKSVQTLQCNVSTFSSWLIALSLLELGAHGILVKYWIATGAPLPWLLPNALAALSTGLIISFIGIRHVRHLPDSKWLYGIVTLIGALIFYSRLVIFKAADVSLWDTSLLIVFAYSLFFIQRLFPSKPLLNMALFMPILVIFTVPLQLAS
ncbi:MAG: hypothetical protein LUQ18_10925, partial [Methylococcaceae bacterium]|nr:hypothetical protein [Methylococcaceae bacterium]